MNFSDSRAHFQDAHYVEDPRSNCLNRKLKSEDDEENVQDTKGEAFNYVSKKARNEDEKMEGRDVRSSTSIELSSSRSSRHCERRSQHVD
jgi:hypothetical protein